MNARITRNLAVGVVVTLVFLIGAMVPSLSSSAQETPDPTPTSGSGCSCSCGCNSRFQCLCLEGCTAEGSCLTGEEGKATEPAAPTQVTYATLGPTQAAWHTAMAPTWEVATEESMIATALAEPETKEECYDCAPNDTCESGWRQMCEHTDPYIPVPLTLPGPCNTKEQCEGESGSGEELPCVPGMMTARVPTGEIEFDRCDRFEWAWELEVHAHPFPRWIVGMGAPLPEPYEWRRCSQWMELSQTRYGAAPRERG